MMGSMETVAVEVTQQEALFMRVGGRPFIYRPVGEKEWRLGWALPGLDVRKMLREKLEPSTGPLEIQTRPKERPEGISDGAWQFEQDQQQQDDIPLAVLKVG